MTTTKTKIKPVIGKLYYIAEMHWNTNTDLIGFGGENKAAIGQWIDKKHPVMFVKETDKRYYFLVNSQVLWIPKTEQIKFEPCKVK
jgi:hypothetical protein